MSPPRPNDNIALGSVLNGFPGFDAKGRMVYRTNYPMQPVMTRDGGMQMPTRPDSAPLLRVDLDTRRADTIASIRTAKFINNTITLPNGGTTTMASPVPLSTIDDWAVLSDGTIAIVRGRDYRVDFIGPDGTKRSSDKINFDWKRLTDDDKLALVDSIQKARTAGPAAGGPMMVSGGMSITMNSGMAVGGGGGGRTVIMGDMVSREAAAAGVAAAAAAAPPPAAASTTASGSSAAGSSGSGGSSTASGGGSAPTNSNAPAAGATPAGSAAGATPSGFSVPALPAPAIADMPDYMPAFAATSARADADGNLWIRTTTPGLEPGNVVYDVINNQGALIDRVDVPKGMTIIGFAKGGTVFLSQREAYAFRVLKASIK
jgi:hypothetical protein